MSWIQEDISNLEEYIQHTENQVWTLLDGNKRKGLGGGERKLLIDLIHDIRMYLRDHPFEVQDLYDTPKPNLNHTF